MHIKLALPFATIVLFGIPGLADPQSQLCARLDDAIAGLKKGWQEAPIGRGLMSDAQLVVIFSDSAGDTWTIMVAAPDGTACVVASGTGWEILPPPKPGVEG